MKVTVDKRKGVKNVDETHSVTQATEAAKIVLLLDGTVHTLAYFQRDDGASLMVGGGKQHFVVTFSATGQNLALKNEDAAEGHLIEVCAGGQYGEYPAEIVCGIDQANEAVAFFFEGCEANLNWT